VLRIDCCVAPRAGRKKHRLPKKEADVRAAVLIILSLFALLPVAATAQPTVTI